MFEFNTAATTLGYDVVPRPPEGEQTEWAWGWERYDRRNGKLSGRSDQVWLSKEAAVEAAGEDADRYRFAVTEMGRHLAPTDYDL